MLRLLAFVLTCVGALTGILAAFEHRASTNSGIIWNCAAVVLWLVVIDGDSAKRRNSQRGAK